MCSVGPTLSRKDEREKVLSVCVCENGRMDSSPRARQEKGSRSQQSTTSSTQRNDTQSTQASGVEKREEEHVKPIEEKKEEVEEEHEEEEQEEGRGWQRPVSSRKDGKRVIEVRVPNGAHCSVGSVFLASLFSSFSPGQKRTGNSFPTMVCAQTSTRCSRSCRRICMNSFGASHSPLFTLRLLPPCFLVSLVGMY